MVTPLTLEVVREVAHLEHVRSEWNRFASTLPSATPFQFPEWQLAWWNQFGSGRLHIMFFRSLDSLVGVIPCYLNDEGILKLIGSGIAGNLEPPIHARNGADVVSLLKGHLLANSAWKFCDWQSLAPNSPLASLQLGSNFDLKLSADVEWSQVPIQGTFEQYWESRSFSLRRNFLKYLDPRTVLPDRPRFEVVTQADPEFLNTLIRVQGQRYPSTFLVDLANVLDAADLLRLFGLRHQKKLVAVTLAFAHRGILYSFLSGHDPDFEALGFGRLILFESLRHAYQQGYRAWNFLGGNEPYKMLWGAQIYPTARISIQRNPPAPLQ